MGALAADSRRDCPDPRGARVPGPADAWPDGPDRPPGGHAGQLTASATARTGGAPGTGRTRGRAGRESVPAARTRSGRRQAGAFTGVWTAGETLGAAAGPALYAAVLALSSFVSAPADERVAQPDSVITGCWWG